MDAYLIATAIVIFAWFLARMALPKHASKFSLAAFERWALYILFMVALCAAIYLQWKGDS